MVKTITLNEFLEMLKAQGVPPEHYAYRCVKCGHIQSAASLVRHVGAERAGNLAYYSCEGRFNSEVGCDWTLGGLFRIHALQVTAEDDTIVGMLRTVPVFVPATPEEAQDLMAKTAGNIRKCRVCGCDDFHACPDGCSWVEPDLCSACAAKEVLHG